MRYDTNLASEYYILSCLYRQGYEAFITLGNKKAIDIVVKFDQKIATIDVKGMAGTTSFPVDNFDASKKEGNHFLVFISFLSRMPDINTIPEIYIVPAKDVEKLTYVNPKQSRRVVNLSSLRAERAKYLNNWESLRDRRKRKQN